MPLTIRDQMKLFSSERSGDAVDLPARTLRGCQRTAIEAAPELEWVKKEGSDEHRRDVISQPVVFGKKALRWMIRAHAKSLALIAAILIFGAQLIAVAHFHQRNITRQFRAPTQVVADDGLCALCILALHVPFNPAAAPVVVVPHSAAQPIAARAVRAAITRVLTSSQSRAPPRLAV